MSLRLRSAALLVLPASLVAALTCDGGAHAGVLYQEQLVDDGGTSARTLPGYTVWQSFTAGQSGTLDEIDMGFFNDMSGQGQLASSRARARLERCCSRSSCRSSGSRSLASLGMRGP